MSTTDPLPISEAFERAIAPDIRKTGLSPDFWYPLARARNLKPGRVLGVSFAGEPIALYRTRDGQVHALEDRCAHRQVPLSTGVVKDDCLQCGYHGWVYDHGGACVNVPYLDKGRTLPNGVRGYPCREAYGLVFVFTGDAAQPGFGEFPQVHTFGNPAYRTRVLDRRVACHYSFMHENLMDMNHQFLHRRLMGRIRTVFLELRCAPGSVEVDYTFERVGGRQPLGEKLMIGRRRHAPEPGVSGRRDLMRIRTGYPYQTLQFWTAGSDAPALDLWNVYVPEDRAQRVNHTFGMMNVRKPGIPGLIHLLWPFIIWFTEGIFAEDRWIVELEQKAFDDQGGDRNNEIFPVIRALREVLVSQGVAIDSAS